jgi:hypothetical protein
MRNTLIHWLGGYTKGQLEDALKCLEDANARYLQDKETIKELQALVPVSAVTPKKRGRPQKYVRKA